MDLKIDDNFAYIETEINELYESIHQFWIKNDLLIEECLQMLTKVDKHKTGCNVAKVVGTSVSGTGSVAAVAGLILIPFTAGVSSLLTIGGTIATAVGTVTNVGTDVANTVISRQFFKNIKRMAEERNKTSEDLMEKISKFDIIATAFQLNDINERQFDGELDLGKTVKQLSSGTVGAYKMTTSSIKLFETLKEMNALKAAKSVETNASLGKSVGKGVISLIPSETKGLSSAAVTTTGVSAGKLAAKGASAALGVAFTVVDIVSLVKDWKTTHPTVHAINGLIEDLRSDETVIRRLQTFVTSTFCELNYYLLDSDSDTNDVEDTEEDEPQIIFDFNENRVLYNFN